MVYKQIKIQTLNIKCKHDILVAVVAVFELQKATCNYNCITVSASLAAECHREDI